MPLRPSFECHKTTEKSTPARSLLNGPCTLKSQTTKPETEQTALRARFRRLSERPGRFRREVQLQDFLPERLAANADELGLLLSITMKLSPRSTLGPVVTS